MALFKINYSAQAVPIEETALTDTNQTIRAIHSSIDKTVGGQIEKSFGEASTNVVRSLYTTTTTGADSEDYSSSAPQGFGTVVITILSAASSSTPDVQVSLDSGSSYPIKLEGVGDFVVLQLFGIGGQEMLIKSSGSTTVANTEILIGGS